MRRRKWYGTKILVKCHIGLVHRLVRKVHSCHNLYFFDISSFSCPQLNVYLREPGRNVTKVSLEYSGRKLASHFFLTIKLALFIPIWAAVHRPFARPLISDRWESPYCVHLLLKCSNGSIITLIAIRYVFFVVRIFSLMVFSSNKIKNIIEKYWNFWN